MSSKRSHESGAEPENMATGGQRSAKRMCTAYPKQSSASVSVQLTLNQLMISAKSTANGGQQRLKSRTKAEGSESGKCSDCEMRCSSGSARIECTFCERTVCGECSLNCLQCCHPFCRLCCVKSYRFSRQNNTGLCLSCPT